MATEFEVPDEEHTLPVASQTGEMIQHPRWAGYFKIVKPTPELVKQTDSQALGDQGSYGNYTWYQRLIQGSASRLTRYREYDLMDNDVVVARALDTIAEEMTGNNPKTSEPIELQITTPPGSSVDGNEVRGTEILTLRTALRRWGYIHDFENKLFKISRTLAKYGDCYFKKKDPFSKWEFVHPKNVIAAVVDKDDVTKVLYWQIKEDIKKSKSSYGTPVTGHTDSETEFIPRHQIVRFTLCDDMEDTAPFGESILRSVYRTHKQKELLEDAILIYRVQRAPERRVFYIDVGKMPPQRVKMYLEQIKNEIKQKKIPSQIGGQNEVQSVYNSQAMSEDFFFASRPDGRGSRVETLPGGQGLGELADLEYFQHKVWEGLRIPLSYMMSGQDNAIMNDGKVGVAYIQELRFALFVMRLQARLETVLDAEFKKFLQYANIIIDDSFYRLRLPPPTNFGKYRQQELDAQLLTTYGSADGIPYMSKRFAMLRYLQMTEEEVAINERMLREERGMDPDGGEEDYPTIYGAATEPGVGGLGGGGFPGGGPLAAPAGMPGLEGEAELGGEEAGMEAGGIGEAPPGGAAPAP